MSLTAGHKLGPYEIIEAAGVGGMGEVYRAKDTRLNRTVAIKVLPARTAQNADLRTRFEREARAISSLNHPNICTLYDVGNQDDMDYLVMEYLEGETVGARVKRGPLPPEELYRYGVQIADALDKAHRQGLIHRDLKPGNIILTKEGAKLLDFGLAKLQIDPGLVDGITGITQSTPLTGTGTILGTMQYMSPEQLEGQEADSRSDIFAFGAVLYEMATGIRAYEGKSQASLIAAILEREPRSISEISPTFPPAFERLVKKCLSKDKEARWQSARDLCDELRWISQSGSLAGVPSPVASRRRFRFNLVRALATIFGLCSLAMGSYLLLKPKPDVRLSKFHILPPEKTVNQAWPRISPDGTMLAFQASDSAGQKKIWIRKMDALEAYPLEGTEGVGRPFWSPDSRFLAFFQGNQLKKISVQGGPAQLIAEAKGGSDGCWSPSGTILFDGSTTDSIRKVSSSGGVVSAATRMNRAAGEAYHMWPTPLPGGEHFLFLASLDSSGTGSVRNYNLVVGSLNDTATATLRKVSSQAEYSPAGYLVFAVEKVLYAQKFDLHKLSLVGEPIPLTQGVSTVGQSGLEFSISNNNTLVYSLGQSGDMSELVWFDRKGNRLGAVGSPGYYGDFRLSPSETKVAFQAEDQNKNEYDIWVADLKRNVSSRLTFEEHDEVWPVWSQDESTIYYANNGTGRFGIFRRPSSGVGEPQAVYTNDSVQCGPLDWLGKSTTMVGVAFETGQADIMSVDAENQTSFTLLFQTEQFNEAGSRVSPDGRFLAYYSDESGKFEVYVRDLSPSGGKWQISTGGGSEPKWRGDGKELIYSASQWVLTAVPISNSGGHLEVGAPLPLFKQRFRYRGPSMTSYAISSDGQRILANVNVNEQSTARTIVVLNWPEQLKQD